METKLNEISQVQREIELFLTNEELQPHFEKAYRAAQPKIDLKGFRKGKVPIPTIKKLFGREIEANALEDIASDAFNQFVQDEKVHVIGQPSLRDIEKSPEGIKFLIKFDTMPGFELSDYRGLQLDEPVHRVTDEEIEHEVFHIQIHNGTLEPAEQITSDLFIAGLKMQELDEASGLPVIGGKSQDTSVFLHDHSVIPELRQSLMNTKVGDTFRFRPHDYDPSAEDVTYEVTVTSIQEVIPAEFTNEFVEKYTQGKFNTTEELREELGYQIQEAWDQRARQALEDQVVSKLVQMNEFEVPESVVHQVLETMAEDLRKRYEKVPGADKITAEGIANDFTPVAENRVKWEIIRAKIIEKEGIEVEEHDIEELSESEALRLKADKNVVRRAIINNQNIRETILSKKLMDLILDFAITNEVPFEGDEDNFGDEHDHDHEHHEHEHGNEGEEKE